MQTAPPLNGAQRGSHGRFASARADLEEAVVGYQAELDELAIANLDLAGEVITEIERDEIDDRRRFGKYQSLNRAIRTGTREQQLVELHGLVAHIEADELAEDERRRGHVPALRLLAGKATELRRIFKTDFVPLILASYAKGGRA